MPRRRRDRPREDETGQVAEALATVHRAALRAAVERAELASGISGVFVNLARRSQVLVHRQLSLLDSMERRSDDPNELSDLFRLDHLTTRMRRHAESLIILSGAAPGRAWRMPVVPDQRGPRGRLRSRGLRARGGTAAPRGGRHRRGRRRPHPPARRDHRERRPVLAAPHARARHRRTRRQRLRRRGRGPRPRHGQGDPRRGQPAHRAVRGARPVRQRPARPLRGQQTRRPARHQGAPAHLARTAAPPPSSCCPPPCCTAARAERSADEAAHARQPDRSAATRACPTPTGTAPRPSPTAQAGCRRGRTVAPAPAAAETKTDTPPPGVTTLRLHRPPERLRSLRGPPAPRTAGQPRPPTARGAPRGTASRRRPSGDDDGAPPNSSGTAWRPTATAGRAAAAGSPAARTTPGPAAGSDSSEGDPA